MNINNDMCHWVENDECFCNSGKKAFDCHIDRKRKYENVLFKLEEKERKNIFHEFIKKDDFKGNCLFKNCKTKAIKSHYIPKNILKKIGNKLKNIDMFYEKEFNEINKNLIGINQISYYLFCKDHDLNLFKSIDKTPFKIKKDNLWRCAIRAAYIEWKIKEISIKKIKNLFKKNIKFAFDYNIINIYKDLFAAINDIKTNINLIIDNKGQIIYKIINTNKLFAACSFSTLKCFSDNKEKIEEQFNPSNLWFAIATMAIPWEGKKMIVISLFPKKGNILDREYKFVNSLNEIDKEKWFSGQILDGDNFWTSKENFEYFNKMKALDRFKILGKNSQQKISKFFNHYSNVKNLFKI